MPFIEIGVGGALLIGFYTRIATLIVFSIMIVGTYVHLVVDDPSLFPLQPEEPIIPVAVMETFEVLVEVYTPGVMSSGLSSPIFWLGMGLALSAGFIAAWPVNYWLVGKGIRHVH